MPEEAAKITDQIDASIASGLRSELWNMSERAPTDRWLNKVGGGTPFLTPEEAAAEIQKIEAKSYVGITDEAYEMAKRAPKDKYFDRQEGNALPGYGKEYLTPAEAEAQIYAMDLKIAASNISDETYEMAKRYPLDKYLNRQAGDLLPGYGKEYLTPEEAIYKNATSSPLALLNYNRASFEGPAEKATWGNHRVGTNEETGDINGYTVQWEIAVTDAEKFQAAMDELDIRFANGEISVEGYQQAKLDIEERYGVGKYLSEAAARVPPDRWLRKPGGGIPLLTQAEAPIETARLAINTPEGLLRENMRAFEGAAPTTNWRQKPIAINQYTGDVLGYSMPPTPYTDAEKYRAALDDLETRFTAGELSSEGYKQALRELAEQYDTGTKLAKQFGEAILTTTVSSLTDEFYELGEAIADGANAWTSFGDAMSDTLEKILVMLPKLAVQAGLQMLTDVNPSNDTLALALIGGGLVGSVGAGLLKSNALGDVYTSPSLHQYANNVYDNPQLFTFAKGGVFAESGPEAIMPLARDSTGKLGVSAKATGNIDIQINNYSSTPIASKTQTITDASGNKKIILTLRDIVRQEIATANAGGVRKS